MKSDRHGGTMRDYSGMCPRDLIAQTGLSLRWCKRKIEEHETLDEIEASEDFNDLRRAVLRLAQLVTGEE